MGNCYISDLTSDLGPSFSNSWGNTGEKIVQSMKKSAYCKYFLEHD